LNTDALRWFRAHDAIMHRYVFAGDDRFDFFRMHRFIFSRDCHRCVALLRFACVVLS
jgi:hypothetical protein